MRWHISAQIFSKMEDDLKSFKNGRGPQIFQNAISPLIFQNGRRPQFFQKWKTT